MFAKHTGTQTADVCSSDQHFAMEAGLLTILAQFSTTEVCQRLKKRSI